MDARSTPPSRQLPHVHVANGTEDPHSKPSPSETPKHKLRRATLASFAAVSVVGSRRGSMRSLSRKGSLARRATMTPSTAALDESHRRPPSVPFVALSSKEREFAAHVFDAHCRAHGVTTCRDLAKFVSELTGFTSEAAVAEWLKGLEGENAAATIPLSTALTVLGRAKASHQSQRASALRAASPDGAAENASDDGGGGHESVRARLFACLAEDDGVTVKASSIVSAIQGCGVDVDVEAIVAEETFTFASATTATTSPSASTSELPAVLKPADASIDFATFTRIMDRVDAATDAHDDVTAGIELEAPPDVMAEDDGGIATNSIDKVLRGCPRDASISRAAVSIAGAAEDPDARQLRERNIREERERRRRNATRVLGSDGLTSVQRRQMRKSIALHTPMQELFGVQSIFKRSSGLPPDDAVTRLISEPLPSEQSIELLHERRDAARRESMAHRAPRRSIFDIASFAEKRKSQSLLSGSAIPLGVRPSLDEGVVHSPSRSVSADGFMMYKQNSFCPPNALSPPPSSDPPRPSANDVVEPTTSEHERRNGAASVRFHIPDSAVVADVASPSVAPSATHNVIHTRNLVSVTPMLQTMDVVPTQSGARRPRGVRVTNSKDAVTVANFDRGTVRILKMPVLRRAKAASDEAPAGGSRTPGPASDRLYPNGSAAWRVNYAEATGR